MLLHDFFDIKKPKVKEDSWHGGGNEPKDAWHSEAGVVEGRVDSPVSSAITRRILNQRHDLLKFGPQAVMDAIDQVAEWVGEVEEIGSSDVSAWVAQVARYLQTQDGQGVAEGLPGEFVGGTAGGVGGAVVGAAVGGPMGALVGGAAGGTAGQIAGRELTDEQKLNEIAPLLALGARLFMAAAPKIAQVAGKVGQAGARGVGQAAKAGAGIAAKNAGQIGVGAGAYEIGSSVADIVKDITAKVGAAVDEKTIFDLATLAFKYAIPAGIVLAILYGGKKAIDSLFADPKTPQGVAEGWKQTLRRTLRRVDPTIKARIRGKSQDQTNQGLDTIDQLAGMGLTSDDMVSRAMKPNTYFRNAERYAKLANKGVAEAKAPSVIQTIRDNISVDEISKDREGNLIFRRGFFYTNNGSAEQFAARIDNELTKLNIPHTIVDKGQVWRPFKGSATTKSQSHWWVKVKISQPSVAEAPLRAVDALVGYPKLDKKVAAKGTPGSEEEARIETIHGSAYTVDPDKYYVWAWDNAVVLYGEYTDANDAKLSLSKIERRATKRLGPAVKGRFEVASGKMLLSQYGGEQGVAEDEMADFIAGGGKITKVPYKQPRKGERLGGSRHIGGGGDTPTSRHKGISANTQGNKVIGQTKRVAETKADYKIKSIGTDSKGDYYISPSTGKKVYRKAKVGDHENPKTGEHKGVSEGANYWTKLQDTRNKKINSLVNELEKSIK